ncbi:hypothetical protein AURDEDRAFT_159749 [Auricularia subglabra TFB-10046 SS5]|nr:hypothetical protein AURDEDRAFT_159749 [Auricularia subglabra TFB-10046 SS5]
MLFLPLVTLAVALLGNALPTTLPGEQQPAPTAAPDPSLPSDENGTGSSCPMPPAWNVRLYYTAGDRVLYHGITYEAKWQSLANFPDLPWRTHWEEYDPCATPPADPTLTEGPGTEPTATAPPAAPTTYVPENPDDCVPPPEWQSELTYAMAARVSFEDKPYMARWETLGDQPSAAEANVWLETGLCYLPD